MRGQRCAHLAPNHHQPRQESGQDGFTIWHARSILRSFFGQDVAGISHSFCRAFTNDACCEPLLELSGQAATTRFPTFAPISDMAPQKRSKFGPIYHFSNHHLSLLVAGVLRHPREKKRVSRHFSEAGMVELERYLKKQPLERLKVFQGLH
jgi:hypothetical protein